MPLDSRSHQATQLRSQAVIDTKSDVKHAPNLPAEEKIVDVEVPTPAVSDQATMPTLYIAVGGIGIRILSRLRDILARRANASQHSTPVEMIAIDTDRAEIKNACSTNWSNPLSSTEALHLPLKLPQVYREQGSHLEWLSHRWLYNIPRSLETRGYRPLGRLAIVDHVNKVLTLIDQKLDQLTAITSGAANQEASEIRIVLLVGMGGGTGSGMVIDLANAVRSRLQATGRRGQVQGVLHLLGKYELFAPIGGQHVCASQRVAIRFHIWKSVGPLGIMQFAAAGIGPSALRPDLPHKGTCQCKPFCR
jgi:hypothetical protein